MKCPCGAGCENRTATCHTECEKYKTFRTKYDALKKRIGKSLPIKIPNGKYYG